MAAVYPWLIIPLNMPRKTWVFIVLDRPYLDRPYFERAKHLNLNIAKLIWL